MTNSLKTVVAVLMAGVMATAPEAATAQIEQQPAGVAAFVEELESDSRAARARAEQKLIDLGEDVLDKLPSAESQSSASVRDALQRIRRQVEFNAAQSTLRGHTIGVGPEGSLQAFLDSLAEESGNRILSGGVPRDLRQVPGNTLEVQGGFFELLDRQLEERGFGWRWGRDGRTVEITLDAEGVPEVPAVYVQGFRLKLIEVKAQRNFVDPETREIFRLGLALDIDPRMNPSWLNVVESDLLVSSVQATPELLNPQARREVPATGQRCLFPVDFSVPARGVPDFVNLEAKVSLRVAVRQKELRFVLDNDVNARQSAGPVRVQLENWSEEADGVEASLRIEFTSPLPELESHRQGALHRDVSLLLQNGTQVKPVQLEFLQSDGQVHRVRYRFRVRSELGRAELLYQAPTLIADLPLTFRLANIPLRVE